MVSTDSWFFVHPTVVNHMINHLSKPIKARVFVPLSLVFDKWHESVFEMRKNVQTVPKTVSV